MEIAVLFYYTIFFELSRRLSQVARPLHSGPIVDQPPFEP